MTLHNCRGGGSHQLVAGMYSQTLTYACTTSATTTDRIDKRGMTKGVVFNESGSAETVTYYAGYSETDTLRALKDNAGNAVTQALGSNEVWDLPAAVSAVPYLAAVGDGGGTLIFCFTGQ